MRQLPVERILQQLATPQYDDYKKDDQHFVMRYDSDHPLFEFYYTDMDFLDKNPEDIIKPRVLRINYMDCLELLRLHYEMRS